MRGFIPLAALVLLASGARAQVPEVSLVTDLRYSISDHDGRTRLRLVDPLARHSTITLQTILENGLLVRLSQRFAKIKNDDAANSLEFGTIEAPGLWRIGLIDAPFGRKWLIRDYGTGAEITSVLVFDALPFQLASIDNGSRRARGVVARFGSRLGLSIALGDHFGATGSSLAMVRDPETAPGVGRGYRAILGADLGFRSGPVDIGLEFVSLRRPHTAADRRDDLLSLEVKLPGPTQLTSASATYTRGFLSRTNAWTLELNQEIERKVGVFALAKFMPREQVYAAGIRVRF